MIYILEHSLLEHFLTIIKNQPSHTHFKYAWSKISSLVAMLVTKDLQLSETFDDSGEFVGYKFTDQFSIVSIFPTGVRMAQALGDLLPNSIIGYVGHSATTDLFKGGDEGLYILPENLSSRKAIICDAMIKTGQSMRNAISRLQIENVIDIKLVTVFATTNGIENLRAEFPEFPIYVCSLESTEELEKISFLEELLRHYNL